VYERYGEAKIKPIVVHMTVAGDVDATGETVEPAGTNG